MANRPQSLFIIIILLVIAIAVSGCEDWDWFGGAADTNITTTTAVRTVVTDINGNPVRNAPVYFSIGKVSSSEDVPRNPELVKVMTDENGVATCSYTTQLDYGDGIWYGASTDPAITDFRNGLYSTNNTIFYDDAKSASNGTKQACIGDEQNLYKLTDRSLVDGVKEKLDDTVFNLRDSVQSLTTSSGEPTETPSVGPMATLAPGTGFRGEVTGYGLSSNTIQKGDNISAYMDIRNTGGKPIKDVEMVGQVFIYDEGKKDYVPWDSTLVREAGIDPANVRELFKNVNIQPGADYRAALSKEVPKSHDVFGFEVPIPDQLVVGKYMMVVRAVGVDANGKQVNLGARSSTFEIAPGVAGK